ncbi:MAG: FAD:protein FMN transferase, partial [Prevotella sp.]|nr:FAD:protein FMN transferase [Prevotella sp.]
AIDSIRAFVGYKKVSIGQKSDPRTMLDCSAIAKGFGCDLVAKLFRRKGIGNFMIEVGGEVVVSGVNEKGEKWRIGVTKPQESPENGSNELQTILQLPLSSPHSGGQRGAFSALATSGNYRNFYVKDGKRYAHTIDPRTGRPVQHSILSATVLSNSCAQADAYATAFMVMDIDGAKRILAQHSDLLAYLIYSDADGKFAVWSSPELK